MKFTIPEPLTHEHEELHARLAEATKLKGPLGDAAKAYDNDMAPQEHLSDDDIAALATYARQRFGAPPVTAPVTPAQVALARARPGLPQ